VTKTVHTTHLQGIIFICKHKEIVGRNPLPTGGTTTVPGDIYPTFHKHESTRKSEKSHRETVILTFLYKKTCRNTSRNAE